MPGSNLRRGRTWSFALALGVSWGSAGLTAYAGDAADTNRGAPDRKRSVTPIAAETEVRKPGYCRDNPWDLTPIPESQPPAPSDPTTPAPDQPRSTPPAMDNQDQSSFNPPESGAIGNPNLVAASTAPFMIGDFLGVPRAPSAVAVIPTPGFPAPPSFVFGSADDPFIVASPGGGGFIGRNKLAENVSPMPRDRVFFNYSLFTNVPLNPAGGGSNVNRFTPGFEKTFLDGLTSLEIRTPFATTLNSNVIADGVTNSDDLQFGNLTLAVKGLIFRSDVFNASTGLQITVPTGPNITSSLSNGTTVYKVDNQSVHLMPFLAGLYTPDDYFYAQGVVQVDVDSNGNTLAVNQFDGAGVNSVGRLRDATFLYASLGGGYWVYRDTETWITGISPVAELHYNRTVSSPNVVTAGPNNFASSHDSIEVINVVLGCNFEINQSSMLTLGYSTPLGGGSDRQFDGEFRAFVNYRFGPQSRLTQSQFAR